MYDWFFGGEGSMFKKVLIIYKICGEVTSKENVYNINMHDTKEHFQVAIWQFSHYENMVMWDFYNRSWNIYPDTPL